MGNWTDTLKGFFNLFLKSNCPLCQRPAERELCRYCHRQLQGCQLANPGQFWQDPMPVFVWGAYGGTLKRAIAAMKYENHPELARPLGHWLGDAWRNGKGAAGAQVTVVPIPLHAAKLKKRGFNQAQLLAQYFCEVTGLPLERNGLQRVRETEAQFSLSAAEREENLAGAFTVGKGFRHRHSRSVLLLDDIYTSGATVRSAAQTLRSAGISVCGVAAIATTAVVNRQDAKNAKEEDGRERGAQR
jgi:ComF family protein